MHCAMCITTLCYKLLIPVCTLTCLPSIVKFLLLLLLFSFFLADHGIWYYENASALIITFIVNNHVNESQNAWAEAWEAEFIKYLKNYKGQYINISFSSEVSFCRCTHVRMRTHTHAQLTSVITESSGLMLRRYCTSPLKTSCEQ